MAVGRSTFLRDAVEALTRTDGSRGLCRAQAAFAIGWTGEWAVMVALGVVAFEDGGAAAVGLVAALRMLPSALLAPFAAIVADSRRRTLVLVWIGSIRAVTLSAAAGLLIVEGSPTFLYGLVMVATIAQTLHRPTHSALLPSLCTGPELTEANVVRGLLDSLATLGGPAAAGLALQVQGPALVFAACGAGSLLTSLLLVGVHCEPAPRSELGAIRARDTLDGLRAITADRDLVLIVGLTTTQTFTRGAFSVLSVVIAIEVLDTGPAGVGVLHAAVGVGAVVGSLLTMGLVRRGGLAGWLGVGVALWGLPLAAIPAMPQAFGIVALLSAVGLGNALVDVGAFTLPAHLAEERVMARVFAAFEGILTLGVTIGAAVTPLAVALLGLRGALMAIGVAGPLVVVATWPALGRLDARMRSHHAVLAPTTPRRRSGPDARRSHWYEQGFGAEFGQRPGLVESSMASNHSDQ